MWILTTHSKLYSSKIFACIFMQAFLHVCEYTCVWGWIVWKLKIDIRSLPWKISILSILCIETGFLSWIQTLLTLNSFAIQLAAEISCFYLFCTRIMGWSPCKTGIGVGAGDLKFSLYNCSASTWSPTLVWCLKEKSKILQWIA